MLNTEKRYQPNDVHVSAKVLDGEAVLIHITRGAYHSMDKVGSRIWQLIEQRHPLTAIASAIASQYEIDKESAQIDVAKLIDELLKADLVVEAAGESVPLSIEKNANRLPYDRPCLNTFNDMADLLALDPPMPGLQAMSPRSESDKN